MSALLRLLGLGFNLQCQDFREQGYKFAMSALLVLTL